MAPGRNQAPPEGVPEERDHTWSLAAGSGGPTPMSTGTVNLWTLPLPRGRAAAVSMTTTDEDALLVARVRDGDDLAFEMLVRRYEKRLQRYVRSLVRDEEKARELVQ